MSTKKEDMLIKVLLVGGAKVGKSSLMRCDSKTPDPKIYKPSVGVDFALKAVETEHSKIRFQIWDVASSEINGQLINTYKSEARVVLYVYSEDPEERETSLQAIDAWEKCLTFDRNHVTIARVGNKSDLADTTQPALAVDPRFGFDIQVSALTQHNFENLFGTLASQIEANASKTPKNDNPELEAYKQAIDNFVESKNTAIPKFQLFSQIRDRANRAGNIDEMRQHVKDLRKEASNHRDKGLMYLFKFCWCRKPKSRIDLDKIFDNSNQLKMKR